MSDILIPVILLASSILFLLSSFFNYKKYKYKIDKTLELKSKRYKDLDSRLKNLESVEYVDLSVFKPTIDEILISLNDIEKRLHDLEMEATHLSVKKIDELVKILEED